MSRKSKIDTKKHKIFEYKNKLSHISRIEHVCISGDGGGGVVFYCKWGQIDREVAEQLLLLLLQIHYLMTHLRGIVNNSIQFNAIAFQIQLAFTIVRLETFLVNKIRLTG